MITIIEIKRKSENLYSEYLKSIISGESFFPKTIRSDKSVSNDFNEMRNELAEVIEHSKDRKSFGYTITYKQVNTRKHKIQSLPEEISFQCATDYLKFLHKEKEAENFKNNANEILTRFPNLIEWIKKYPKKIIENCGKWKSLLDVCSYFTRYPKPNLYIRELPVKVHTKFIENHKAILLDLLNVVLQTDNINHEYTTTKDFEKRFGLKFNQSQIRLKILDTNISQNHLSGLTDIEVTEEEFIKLQVPCDKVFIFENKTNFSNLMNFLTLPKLENAIGIFGSGYKVADLKNALWLKDKDIYYWGDIDTHGLQILSQIRGYFRQTKSIMMDFETLNTFKEDWGRGESINVNVLPNLYPSEQELFLFVKADNLNTIRLEQEKIGHEYVLKQITKIFSSEFQRKQ
ncbi:MAG: hypothetical protein H0W61_10185 [Bacteroidetes bacterium]|nr:hypothetical protein [Bacteroidota bacterium]